MKNVFRLGIFVLGLLLAVASGAQAASGGAAPPTDPWPRVVDLANGQVLVYQPQVNAWADNRLDFRAAMAVKRDGVQQESFGVITATVRTQVDKVLRTVAFEDFRITKVCLLYTSPSPRD